MEFSTPLVQLRWFFGKGHPLYVVNGALMTLAFLACRLYPMMPYNAWAIYISQPHHHSSGLPLSVRIAASALFLPHVLNLFWGYKMVTGLLGVLFGKGKGSKASSSAAERKDEKAATETRATTKTLKAA